MGTMEIILLIVGAALVIAGFIIPDKGASLSQKDIEYGQKQIDEMVERELSKARSRIEETVDETVTYAVEKTERGLERITNEKMLAIGEYSDTVIRQIDENHKEVMFLYDMLNDKHEALKSTVATVTTTVKQVETAAQDVRISMEETRKSAEETRKSAEESHKSVEETPAEDTFSGLTPVVLDAKEAGEQVLPKPGKRAPKKKTEEAPLPEIDDRAAGVTGANNNERILALHRLGKSNMAIARELGLGIGEVNLVIGLYEE